MADLFADYMALALLGIAGLCMLLYLAGPKDKPRRPSDSRCYCVTFEDGDS